MKLLRRIWTVALLSFALLLPAARLAPAAHADDYSGQWNALLLIACQPNTPGAAVCANLLGPGGMNFLANGLTFDCDAAGTCTYRAYFVGASALTGQPYVCDPSVFGTPFSGTCRDSEIGTVSINSGVTGLPDFFITDEYANFYPNAGSPLLRGVHLPAGAASYPLDTGTPAVAGYYDTARNLQLIGMLQLGQVPPAGLTFIQVVNHNPGGSGVIALPLPAAQSGAGSSSSFLVSWFTDSSGNGQVYFGSGPNCQGLVETSTRDAYAGFDLGGHAVFVTGNDLPGTVGDNGITPGTTYSYQPVTVTASGSQADTNNGRCYSVTIPA
jgi:hypothetical protein